MKKQSTNSKTFWENDYVLKTATQRKKIEFLAEKHIEKNNTIMAKIKKVFFKIF
jgi:hypothetical protein